MTAATLQAVEAAALQLSAEDRAALIGRLIDSVEPPPSLHPDWQAEIDRRVADMDLGRTEFSPGEAVMSNLRTLIAAHGPKV